LGILTYPFYKPAGVRMTENWWRRTDL